MQSKLSVPGCPTNLDNSRARAYCACSRLDIFSLVSNFSFLSPSLGDAGPRGPVVRHLTRKSEVLDSISSLATHFRFSFR